MFYREINFSFFYEFFFLYFDNNIKISCLKIEVILSVLHTTDNKEGKTLDNIQNTTNNMYATK